MLIDKHTLAVVSLVGSSLDVLGALYLVHDLLGAFIQTPTSRGRETLGGPCSRQIYQRLNCASTRGRAERRGEGRTAIGVVNVIASACSSFIEWIGSHYSGEC